MKKTGARIGFWYAFTLLFSHVAHFFVSTLVQMFTFAGADLDGKTDALLFGLLYGIAVESLGREWGRDVEGIGGSLWKRHLRMCWPIYAMGAAFFVGLAVDDPQLLDADMGGGIRFFRYSSWDRMLIRMKMVWMGAIPGMLLGNLWALAKGSVSAANVRSALKRAAAQVAAALFSVTVALLLFYISIKFVVPTFEIQGSGWFGLLGVIATAVAVIVTVNVSLESLRPHGTHWLVLHIQECALIYIAVLLLVPQIDLSVLRAIGENDPLRPWNPYDILVSGVGVETRLVTLVLVNALYLLVRHAPSAGPLRKIVARFK